MLRVDVRYVNYVFLCSSLLQDGFNNFKTFVEEELQTSMVRLNQLAHDCTMSMLGSLCRKSIVAVDLLLQ